MLIRNSLMSREACIRGVESLRLERAALPPSPTGTQTSRCLDRTGTIRVRGEPHGGFCLHVSTVMAERDAEIIARGYDQVADAYEALESAEKPWPRLERVRAFAADLPHGSQVLDIGCGNGVPATQELALRHEVTGVDISEEQIARARSNVPTAT